MNVKPEEVLVEAWIPTYKTGIRILHNPLVQIRSMLFILEHIAQFPFSICSVEHPRSILASCPPILGNVSCRRTVANSP